MTFLAPTRFLLSGLMALLLPWMVSAQQSSLPTYTPAPLESGVIRSWGDDAMRGIMRSWEAAFRRFHPEITFQDTLLGTATSMAGIITNTSDLSLMGRPASTNEIIGFEWVYRVKPLGIQVMNDSLETEGHTPALAVLVSRTNPLQQISMAQLATLLGCPTEQHAFVTWAMAGATGSWAHRPVHAYLYDDQTGTGAFLQQAILGKGDCWNWSIVHEFKDRSLGNGNVYTATRQIRDALQHDPDGLAIATLASPSPGVKALSVAASGAPVGLSESTVISGEYPLARGVYIYIRRASNKPVDPKVAEFLRFVLSAEGQTLVKTQSDFLPLNPAAAAAARKQLE